MAVELAPTNTSVEQIDINLLHPHPRNVEIYGEENVPALIEKIKYSKWIKPLVISQHNRIISGHSRWKAARTLGYEQIPVEMRVFADEIEELEALLLENVSRVKTNTQVANEGKEWEDIFAEKNRRTQEAQGDHGQEGGRKSIIEQALQVNTESVLGNVTLGANLRQGLAPKNNNKKPTTPKKQRAPKTSEQAAQAVGKKSRNYEKMASVRKSIEQLGKLGKTGEAKVLGDLFDKSVDGAYQLADLEKPDNLAILTKIANKEAKDVKEAKKLVKKEEIERLQQADAIATGVAVKKREVQPGQWWKLGDHLLYCGDSSSPEFINRAEDAQPSFAFADPPYNAGVAIWDSGFNWKHDYLATIAPIVAVTPGISAIHYFMRLTNMPYKWSMAYWINNGMTRGAVGFGNWIYAALFANESVHKGKQDFDQVSISNSERSELEHKGQKPLPMMLHLIKTFTNENDTVIDPFLGTGTTLVVCEKTKRVCIGAELDPEYCTAIIKRWEVVSGQKAEEVTDGTNPIPA